ncbi:type I secretion system permease/ATPase [Phenylobacterium sp.]|uniref:type I secretion system permease/ATPase n=1 Tax=Phenylobacterium sp. TaxID=1871053 RepID=UPI0035B01FE7
MKLLSFLNNQPDTVLTRAIKEGRTPLLFAFGFSLVSNVLYLAMPIYTFQIYGRVLTSQSGPTLWALTIVTLFVFIISAVIDDYRGRILVNYGVLMDQQVSGRLFSALFDGALRGEPGAKSQALRDLDTFRQTLTGIGAAAFFDLPWIPVFLVVLWAIDPLVGTVTTVGAVALFGLALAQERVTRPALKDANEAALRSYAFTDAALRNGEVVRAMGMLPRLGAAWARHRRISIERGADASEGNLAFSDAIKAVRMGIQILVIAIGAWLIMKGEIHSAMLFANMILASRALAPIERVVGAWEPLNNGIRAHERVMNVLSRAEPPSVSTALPRPAGRLTVEGVVFTPAGSPKPTLMGVNFALQPGETLGVIGPSGAGKSTLSRLLMGIWKPLQGSVRLDGADVFSWDRADFGRHVGYLPQDTELFSGSVRDNIARFREDVTDDDVIRAAQMANVHDLILRLPRGYETDIGESGVVLSVGQRQRVGLARALLCDPAFLVLDEPNASLDAEGENALMAALDTMKARGATIIIVSHKPSVFRSADKILMLRDGRQEAFGPRDQVLSRVIKPAEVRTVEAGR